jgi:hypothetical protein
MQAPVNSSRATPLYDLGCSATSVPPLTAMRGGVVFAGWKVLRAHGHYETYEARVPLDVRDALHNVTSNDWVPLSIVDVHERACDSLGMPREEARAVGVEMSRVLNGIVYTTILRLAGKVGASPWLVFSQANKTWRRLYQGGAVAVYRLGERDARVEVLGDPLSRYPLHREAFGGALLHVVESFCERPMLMEVAERRDPMSFSYLVRW